MIPHLLWSRDRTLWTFSHLLLLPFWRPGFLFFYAREIIFLLVARTLTWWSPSPVLPPSPVSNSSQNTHQWQLLLTATLPGSYGLWDPVQQPKFKLQFHKQAMKALALIQLQQHPCCVHTFSRQLCTPVQTHPAIFTWPRNTISIRSSPLYVLLQLIYLKVLKQILETFVNKWSTFNLSSLKQNTPNKSFPLLSPLTFSSYTGMICFSCQLPFHPEITLSTLTAAPPALLGEHHHAASSLPASGLLYNFSNSYQALAFAQELWWSIPQLYQEFLLPGQGGRWE